MKNRKTRGQSNLHEMLSDTSACERRRSFLFEFLFVYLFAALGVVANMLLAQEPQGYTALIHIVPATCLLVVPGQLFFRYKKVWYGLLYAVFAITGIVYITHLVLYGAVLDPESGAAILATDRREALGYIRAFANWRLMLLLIAFVTVPYLLFSKIQGTQGISRWEFVAVLMLVLLYLPTAAVRSFKPPLQPLFVAEVSTNIKKAYDELRLISDLDFGYPLEATAIYPGKQTIILLVGESATRNHMHRYGYRRQTTPHSEALDHIYAFNDVISAAPTTQLSMGYMLTFADLENKDFRSTVFDLFRKAGFKTWWISAQFSTQKKIGAGIVPILAQRADVQWASLDQLPAWEQYDEYLLPVIQGAVADPAPRKFIIVQLMGSHTVYAERIPPNRRGQNFTDVPPGRELRRALVQGSLEEAERIVNAYDDSIRYTDFVISQVLEMTQNAHGTALSVLYVADHGEEVFNTEPRFGHAGSSRSQNVYEIPMLLRMTPRYEGYLVDSGRIVIEPRRPYQTDSLIHTLINLAAIDTPLYDSKRSILDPEYRESPRTIKGGARYLPGLHSKLVN